MLYVLIYFEFVFVFELSKECFSRINTNKMCRYRICRNQRRHHITLIHSKKVSELERPTILPSLNRFNALVMFTVDTEYQSFLSSQAYHLRTKKTEVTFGLIVVRGG